jgi:PadR family transcriptional regulator PadR
MNMAVRNPSLMTGVPELLVLRLLAERDMYGYEIARAIKRKSDDALSLGDGVLYPALHGLEARRLLRSRSVRVDGRTRIYYGLTTLGRSRLARLREDWRRMSGGIEALLGSAGHG